MLNGATIDGGPAQHYDLVVRNIKGLLLFG